MDQSQEKTSPPPKQKHSCWWCGSDKPQRISSYGTLGWGALKAASTCRECQKKTYGSFIPSIALGRMITLEGGKQVSILEAIRGRYDLSESELAEAGLLELTPGRSVSEASKATLQKAYRRKTSR